MRKLQRMLGRKRHHYILGSLWFWILPLLVPLSVFVRNTAASLKDATVAAKVENVCFACHSESFLAENKHPCSRWMKHGHPVYVTPSDRVQIPKKFPLNNGQLYCGTCHTVNKDSGGEKGIPTLYSDKVFLRFENDSSSLCMECHRTMEGETSVAVPNYNYMVEGINPSPGADNKTTAISYNHPVNKKFERIPKPILEAGGSFGTSKDMITCETCHLTHQAGDDKLLVMNNTDSDLCAVCHPAMLAYDRQMASRRGTHPVNIVPSLARVAPGILTAGGKLGAKGKVTCLTCHKVHNARNKSALLLEDNKQSSFCIKCHSRKGKNVKNTKHDLRISAPKEKNLKGQTAAEGGPCAACHMAHNGSGPKMWAKEIIHEDSNAISKLCESCHWEEGCASAQKTGDFSHPVGRSILKVSASSSSFPLFSHSGARIGRGEVTCASCHDVHTWKPFSRSKGSLKVEGTAGDSFLRVANVKSSICKKCHSDKLRILGTEHDPLAKLFDDLPVLKDKKGEAEGICEQCHVTHNANSVLLWRREVADTDDDEVTRICASCHSDGQVAEDKQVGEFTHPVDRSILKLGKHVKRARIGLPLFSDSIRQDSLGRVFCNSCHNVHQWSPTIARRGNYKELEGDATNSFLRKSAASNEKDGLCGACHIKKRYIVNTDHDMRVTAPEEKNLDNKTVAETGVCASCHATHNAMEGIALWNKKLGEGEDPISRRCNSCHVKGGCAQSKPVAQSHPVGVAVTEDFKAAGLNMYNDDMKKVKKGGKMYCSTCHDTHQWAPGKNKPGTGKNREGDTSNSFLRVRNDIEQRLCLKCHQEKEQIKGTHHDLALSVPGEKNAHGGTAEKIGICENCHSVHNATTTVKLWAKKLGPGIDAISKLCNSCHAGGQCAQRKTTGANSHPVNVKILATPGTDKLPLYDERGHKIENGLVTCGTCHDSHIWSPDRKSKKLVEGSRKDSFLRIADSAESELCRTCHPDKTAILETAHNLAASMPESKNILGETSKESGVCRSCHLVHNSLQSAMLYARKTSASLNKDWDEKIVSEINPITTICIGCHSSKGAAAGKQPYLALHKDGMFILQKEAKKFGIPLYPAPYMLRTVGKQIPISVSAIDAGFMPAFPLFDKKGHISWGGDIACSTCHDSHQINPAGHQLKAGSLERGGIVNNFLRPGIVGGLCADCHGVNGYFLYAYYHRSRSKMPLSKTSVHWSRDNCLACHKSAPKEGDKDNLRFGGNITELCTSCHNGKNASREIHPLGIKLNPEKVKLPLSDQGEMDCLTCHDLSQHKVPSGNLRLFNPSFIRFGASGTPVNPQRGQKGRTKSVYPAYRINLCFECHGEGSYKRFNPHQRQLSLDGKRTNNEQVCLLCHTSIAKDPSKSKNDYRLRDSLEKHCIGCHPAQIKQHPFNSNHYGKELTPVVSNVLKLAMRSQEPDIPLAEGKVVCPTCHNPHQKGVSLELFGKKKPKRDIRTRLVGYGSCTACHSGAAAPSTGSPF